MVKCICVFHDGSRQVVMADKYKIKWADKEKKRELSYMLFQGTQQALEVPVDWIKKPDWLAKLEKVEDE